MEERDDWRIARGLRPEVLDTVGVDFTVDVSLSVIDDLLSILADAIVRLQFVGSRHPGSASGDLNSSLGNRIGKLNAHCAEADTHQADAGQKPGGKAEALIPRGQSVFGPVLACGAGN